ncbi:PREDICTED: uncharacterized protein LOC109587523 [Amphimedon queenslandica]|uniref:Fibronectin type-III domain-containing protein n=1 Tax=Amphimedon queenslandica TaxID=400682 RepID=A0AAN0JQM3_AMPQE|nr:PREDICTED: uncharacterized protein LOC109587523 [Amphimedon queenslandica]|eukprot:XP_019859326.1 PREDICTED: uncharacterized protein LOC109587523 [Amphimedon queenslandica]
MIIEPPIGAPKNLVLLETEYNVIWDELKCSEQNGLITGYTVMISNSSITYNLTSTNTHITLNDLVFDTEYNISVAAVNAIGSGPFSDHITIVLYVSSPSSSIFLPSSSSLIYYHTHATSVPRLLLLSSSQTSPPTTSTSYTPTPFTTSPPILPLNTTTILATGVVLIVSILLIIIIVIVCILRYSTLISVHTCIHIMLHIIV